MRKLLLTPQLRIVAPGDSTLCDRRRIDDCVCVGGSDCGTEILCALTLERASTIQAQSVRPSRSVVQDLPALYADLGSTGKPEGGCMEERVFLVTRYETWNLANAPA
jgi:hypothetical protein